MKVRRLAEPIIWLVLLLVATAAMAFLGMKEHRRYQSELRQYAGLEIGSSPEEVYYQLGLPAQVLGAWLPMPNKLSPAILPHSARYRALYSTAEDAPPAEAVPKGNTLYDFNAWLYRSSKLRGEIQVEFGGRPAALQAVTCFAREDQQCPTRLNIQVGTSESKLAATLGRPDKTSYIGDVKVLTYEESGSEFLLQRQHVYGIRVRPARQS